MIYRSQFIKEATLTAIAIFLLVLAVLVFTQGINLLGRAANGHVAIEAVAALIGFWTLGMTPLLLVLTAYIGTMTVLTRYWRDSEMAVWLSCGLGLKQWIRPVLAFVLPLAVLVAVMQLAVLPWAELRSREYAELLKQKQNLSLIEQGSFQSIGKKNGRVYFVETFDAEGGKMQNLFLREIDKHGRDSVVFAKEGSFTLENDKRTLSLHQGYRYNGSAGSGDFDRVSFERLDLVISTAPKLVEPIDHRRTIPTSELVNSHHPEHKGELMWRISLPVTVVLLGLLAIPLSYYNTRSGSSYHVLTAVGFFLFYQNGLTLLRNGVDDGSLNFWIGLLPMHLIIAACIWLLLRMRSMPARPFLSGLKAVVTGAQK